MREVKFPVGVPVADEPFEAKGFCDPANGLPGPPATGPVGLAGEVGLAGLR
jgi:hypothetical protein